MCSRKDRQARKATVHTWSKSIGTGAERQVNKTVPWKGCELPLTDTSGTVAVCADWLCTALSIRGGTVNRTQEVCARL